MLQNIGITEIVIIAIVILLLFGAKKISEFVRGITKAIKEFKQGYRGEDEEKEKKE